MWKAGDHVDKAKLVKEVFNTVGTIAKTSDFVAAGLKEHTVFSLCKQGCIERIKYGYYKLPDLNEPQEEYLLSKLLTKGIVCVESALFYYGYNDFAPREWTISVPRSYSKTVKAIRKELPVKAYYVQNEMYHLGETTGLFNGVELPVYDRERTICDCFKYRTKLDNETFNKALNAYVADDRKNLANLSRYAKKMNLYTKVMNVMEVLLGG